MKKECIVGEGEMLRLDSVLVMEAAKSDCLREMHACSFCSCPRQGLSHLPAAAAHFTHSLRECGRMASKIPLAEKNPHIVLQNAWGQCCRAPSHSSRTNTVLVGAGSSREDWGRRPTAELLPAAGETGNTVYTMRSSKGPKIE